MMPSVLIISGHDPSGGAGFIADIRTVSFLKVYPFGVMTNLTVQNSLEFTGNYIVSYETIKQQLKKILEERKPDAVKIGMIGDVHIVNTIVDIIIDYDLHNIISETIDLLNTGSKNIIINSDFTAKSSHIECSISHLQNAILNTANLEHTILNNSCFVDAIMNNCILNYAKMKEVDMSGASVNHSSLIKVDFGKGSVFKHTQFHQSILIGAGLKSAKLNGAGLRSSLSWAIMDSADLRYADAVGAKMVGTKLRKADLTHLTLEGAVLIKAELMESDLTEANLHKALLHGTNLSNTKLIQTNLTYAKLNPINSDDFPWETYKYGDENDKFIFPEIQYHGPTGPAILNGCDFSGTKLEMTIMIGVDLREVKNIEFKEIMKAIGDESTKLPDDLKNREDTIRKAWHDNIINDE